MQKIFKRNLTKQHPNAKTNPCVKIEHEHQINVDENTDGRKKWNYWHLKLRKL